MRVIKQLSILLVLLSVLSACGDKSASEYLAEAKALIAQHNYKAATIELKNAIKQKPSLAEARFLLGKSYLKLRQFESAEKEFNRALEFNYPSNEVIPLLSQSYQRTRANNALIKISHKQKGLTTAQATEVAFYKIQAFARLKQDNKAKKLIKEIRNYKTNSPFKSLALVYALLLDKNIKNNTDTALIQLDNILQKHPKQPDALKLKASILLTKNKLDKAAEVYHDYVSYYPNDLEASFVYARLLTDLNKPEEAEPIVDKLLAINSDNMLLNQLKGLARFNAKDYKNALIYSEKAIQKNPEDTALRLVAGTSAFLLKNYQVANQHLSFIASQLPPTHQALRMLAASQLKLGLTLDASDTLTKVSNVNEADSSLFSSVGLALVQQGEVVKAKDILNKSPQITQQTKADSDQLARLGLLKLSLNDVSGIINLEKALETAKEGEANNTKASVSALKNTLATAYLSSGKYQDALNLATRWQQEQPDNAQAYFVAALAYLQQQQRAKAKQEFQQLLKHQPNNVKAKMALLSLNATANTAVENKQALIDILAIKADYIPALIQLYALAKQQNDSASINNTIARFKTQIQKSPKNVDLQVALARVYLTEKRYQDSIVLLENLKAKLDKPAPFWAMLGQSYVQEKQYDKAKKLFQAWIKQAPSNKTALLGNIIALDAEGNFTKALELTENYLATRGDDPQVLLLKSYLLAMNNKFEQAQQIFAPLPKYIKQLAFAKGVLGIIQLHNNENKAALANLQAAYKVMPNSRNARLITLTFYKLKQPTKGQAFLAHHVKKYPEDQASLMQLANEQLQVNSNNALTSYQKAVQLNPNNGVAQNNLAYLYMQKGQLDKALQHAKQAVKIMPNNENVLDTLGQIYRLKKDYKNALTYFNKAVNTPAMLKQKNANEIYLNYIEALLLNKQTALAKRKIAKKPIVDTKLQQKLAQLNKQFNLQ